MFSNYDSLSGVIVIFQLPCTLVYSTSVVTDHYNEYYCIHQFHFHRQINIVVIACFCSLGKKSSGSTAASSAITLRDAQQQLNSNRTSALH
jgi:hypothetical protein